MARRKMNVTAEQLEELARSGLSVAQIAGSLGMSESTLRNRLRESEALQLAIDKGRADSVEKVANKLFEAAMNGNVTAMIFFLKCRAGWKETERHELTGADGEAVTIETNQEYDLSKLSLADLEKLEALLYGSKGLDSAPAPFRRNESTE